MYFTEFKFRSADDTDCLYWLPVLINSSNAENAEEVKDGIMNHLTRKFKVVKTYDLMAYEKPFYSDFLKTLAESGQKAEIEKLNLKALTIDSFERELYVTPTAEYQIVPQMLLAGHPHTITNKLNRRGFLATQFHTEADYEKEFLVLKLKSEGIDQSKR